MEKAIHWYAVRAFWNKTQSLMTEVKNAGYRTYYAVRTTEGVYKGAKGIVRRIKKDRKLLVAITGVAVVEYNANKIPSVAP